MFAIIVQLRTGKTLYENVKEEKNSIIMEDTCIETYLWPILLDYDIMINE